ncbi:hypothetical protein J3R82DRAFT_10848 [Butyriboletus roseoflavus]|nr:hypothetical protein J3R82DRAFT_10848 [Butyriboletus roseoflavus]
MDVLDPQVPIIEPIATIHEDDPNSTATDTQEHTFRCSSRGRVPVSNGVEYAHTPPCWRFRLSVFYAAFLFLPFVYTALALQGHWAAQADLVFLSFFAQVFFVCSTKVDINPDPPSTPIAAYADTVYIQGFLIVYTCFS